MTQEEKQLLLKDLCGRLPYGVKMHLDTDDKSFDTDLVGLPSNNTVNIHDKENYETIEECFIWNIKPYLRPMSSMTEEEKMHFWCLNHNPNTGVDFMTHAPELIDWLNENYFDYRKTADGKTMIEAGLALEAKEGMYD